MDTPGPVRLGSGTSASWPEQVCRVWFFRVRGVDSGRFGHWVQTSTEAVSATAMAI